MRLNGRAVVVALLPLIASGTSFALNPDRLWLPKRHSVLEPKMLASAMAAESTARCQEVINGQYSPAKSSEEGDYFIISCRDENFVSYNMSYWYSKDGSEPELVNEQNSRSAIAVSSSSDNSSDGSPAVTAEEPGFAVDAPEENIPLEMDPDWGGADWGDREWNDLPADEVVADDDQVAEPPAGPPDHLQMCQKVANEKTRSMIDVEWMKGEGMIAIERQTAEGSEIDLPFNAKNPVGVTLKYIARCSISHYDDVRVAIKARK